MLKLLFTLFVGVQCSSMLDTVSQLRMEAFKEYPYLYEGDKDYESHYTNIYTQEQAIVVKAIVDGNLAGIITGIPLVEDAKNFPEETEIFMQHNFDPNGFYYIGEVIVLSQHKLKNIGTQLFKKLEQQAYEWGYRNFCLVTIEHEKNHPLRPLDYQDSDSFFQKLGYVKTEIKIPAKYPTICADGSVREIQNILAFWIKHTK